MKNLIIFILVGLLSISCSSTHEEDDKSTQNYTIETADTRYLCSVDYWVRQDANNNMPAIIGFSYIRINTNITQAGALYKDNTDYPNNGIQFNFSINNTVVLLTLKDNTVITYNFCKATNNKINIRYLKLNNTIYMGQGSGNYSEHDF
jgi:hypothetical protein